LSGVSIRIAGNALTQSAEYTSQARIFRTLTQKTADFCGFEGYLSRFLPKSHASCEGKNGGNPPFFYLYL
jgi:secreted trypsin-like serine protease